MPRDGKRHLYTGEEPWISGSVSCVECTTQSLTTQPYIKCLILQFDYSRRALAEWWTLTLLMYSTFFLLLEDKSAQRSGTQLNARVVVVVGSPSMLIYYGPHLCETLFHSVRFHPSSITVLHDRPDTSAVDSKLTYSSRSMPCRSSESFRRDELLSAVTNYSPLAAHARDDW